MKIRACVVGVVVLLLSGGAVAATGADAVGFERVAANPQSADEFPGLTPEGRAWLESLPPEERDEIVLTMLAAEEEETVNLLVPADAEALVAFIFGGVSTDSAEPFANGCWLGWRGGEAKALAGNTLYTYYHTGRWCISNGTVTSAGIFERGGETSTPGWSYHGPIAGNAGVLSNQGRSYSQFRFRFQVGPVVVQEPTPCVRVNGLANATYTGSWACGIS